MTSIASTFFDALVTKCAAVWPNSKLIANALEIESAPSILLQDGYAIAMGPSTATNRDQSCQERITRDVLIVKTLLVSATENDSTKMIAAQKTLLEYQFDLREALRLDNTLGGVISDIGFSGDGGIEFIATVNGAGRFFVLSSLYSATYIENLY